MLIAHRVSCFVQILVLSLVFSPVICSPGIFETVRGILKALSQRVEDFTCSHISCCKSHLKPTEWSWMWYKANPLFVSLHSNVFGQHLVQDAVLRGIALHMTKPSDRLMLYKTIKKVQDHLQEDITLGWENWYNERDIWDNPYHIWDGLEGACDKLIYEEYQNRKKVFGRALLIWMYGPTGTGKSYTSEIIAESIYEKGLHSPLVHRFGGKAYISVETNQYGYGLRLLDWIDGNITSCPHSMFIFDDFNEWPIHLIHMVLQSAMNNRYRDAIFIFIMTTEGSDTMEKMLALYEEGKIRDNIKLEDVHKPGFRELFSYLERKYELNKCIVEEKFMNGNPKNAIFAPFLPLEKQHVRECIVNHYINEGGIFPSDDIIRSIENNVKYGPMGKETFALFGCKHIHSLVISDLSRRHKYEEDEEL